MRALWLEKGIYTLRDDVDTPDVTKWSNCALVRVLRAGICLRDLQLQQSDTFCGIPGHEFVGIVFKCPDAPELIGKRVVADIYLVCNKCSNCLAGLSNHCLKRSVLGILNKDGAFAEFIRLPIHNLHVVPPSIPDDVACFAEPLAAALQVQDQVEITIGMRVLVIGDGKLGLLIAQTLKLTRCQLRVVGRYKQKLEILNRMGIETDDGDEFLKTDYYDLVIECSGNASAFDSAIACTRHRGTLLLKSTYSDRLLTPFNRNILAKEISLVGSRCGPVSRAVSLLTGSLMEGNLDIKSLLSAEYPFDRALDAIEHARHPEVLKVHMLVNEKIAFSQKRKVSDVGKNVAECCIPEENH